MGQRKNKTGKKSNVLTQLQELDLMPQMFYSLSEGRNHQNPIIIFRIWENKPTYSVVNGYNSSRKSLAF